MSDQENAGQSAELPHKSGLNGTSLAGLDAIAGEESQAFADVQQAQDKAQQHEAQAQESEAAAGWLQAVESAKDLICAPFPEAEPVWTKTRMENLAAALARCDAQYGWGGLGSILSNPLVGLALVSFPLAAGTVKAVNSAKPAKPQQVPGAIVADNMGESISVAVGPDGAPITR